MGLQTGRWHKSIGLYIILHCCYRVKHTVRGTRLVLCVCSTHLIWSTSRTRKLATQKQVDCICCRMEVVPCIELNVFQIHVVIMCIFYIFSHVKRPQWSFDNKVFSCQVNCLQDECGFQMNAAYSQNLKKKHIALSGSAQMSPFLRLDRRR